MVVQEGTEQCFATLSRTEEEGGGLVVGVTDKIGQCGHVYHSCSKWGLEVILNMRLSW